MYVTRVRWLCIYRNDGFVLNGRVALKLRTGGSNSPGVFILFTGDAEVEAECDYIISGEDISANVLKIGHHGSYSSTCQEFLNTVNPQYAVISCGVENTYGHPHEETLEKLRNYGCFVYRTDEQGSIVVSSDGNSLSFSCDPSETWLPGVVSVLENNDDHFDEQNEDDLTEQFTYILNTNTKRFHYSWCDSVKDMSEKNKKGSNDSREDIISEGYIPCKRCNP